MRTASVTLKTDGESRLELAIQRTNSGSRGPVKITLTVDRNNEGLTADFRAGNQTGSRHFRRVLADRNQRGWISDWWNKAKDAVKGAVGAGITAKLTGWIAGLLG
ncbi:hypothetical protein BV898_10031 [Hypsibius exemplaris]|uniref:Uncharacterized protein n=1 Tax=Hypsibius exemplaris TaxID=2072580 RepID=A0A1W0WKP1_HYPEX|nr:hypothetical protein BV898_10031 [Hypsibius exemplaris]